MKAAFPVWSLAQEAWFKNKHQTFVLDLDQLHQSDVLLETQL